VECGYSMSRIIVIYNFLTKISSPKKKSYFYIYNNYLIKIIVVKIPFTVIPYYNVLFHPFPEVVVP
jgi:hypothetical protein